MVSNSGDTYIYFAIGLLYFVCGQTLNAKDMFFYTRIYLGGYPLAHICR